MVGFSFQLVDTPSLKDLKNLDLALLRFLNYIGYMKSEDTNNLGFRLIKDCFLKYPSRAFTVDELLNLLNTNRPTLYNYLKKLKGYEILDEVPVPSDIRIEGAKRRRNKKGYKLKFEDFTMAFNITLKKAEAVLDVYRSDVEHLGRLIGEEELL